MENSELIKKITIARFTTGALDELLKIDGCVLAGGAIRDMMLGETPKDYDFFFTSIEALKEGVFLLSKFKHSGSFYVIDYEVPENKKIQLITKTVYTSPENIISCFDFTNTQFAFDGESLFIGQNTMNDIKNKIVGINVITKPLDSLIRLERYTNNNKACGIKWDVDNAYSYILDVMKNASPATILNTKKYDL